MSDASNKDSMVIKTASKRGEAHISALANFGYWRSRFSFSPLSQDSQCTVVLAYLRGSTVNRDFEYMYDSLYSPAEQCAYFCLEIKSKA